MPINIDAQTLIDLGRSSESWIDKYLEKNFSTGSIWTKSTAAEFADICENNVEALIGVSGDKGLDRYFLNAGEWIYPYYVDMIVELWEERKKRNIEYIYLIGAFGVGKTAVNSVLSWLFWFDFTVKYKEDSLVACPQEYFGLRPTSKVAFLSLSKTLKKSRDVTFNEMKASFNTQFNKEFFPVNERIQSRIDIPANNTLVFPNTATEASNAGYNVYMACLDEINFLEVVDNSVRAIGAGNTVYDQAESAFMSADGRRKSRFGKMGGGVIICFSSVNHSEDFLTRKAKDYYRGIGVDNVFIRYINPWDVRPDHYGNKYFYIDTEKLERITDEEHIELLDKYYVEPDPLELRFGDHKKDPNVRMLAKYNQQLEGGNHE